MALGQNYQEKKRQKQIFGVFLFIGIFALAFGIYQLNHQLRSPFKIQEKSNTNNQASTSTDELAALNNLKTRDTDEDGLSDYDELYFYSTSPYLDDSDSDGIKDKNEVEAGTDPNCPEGKDCTQSSIASATNQAVNQSGNQTVSLAPENIPIDTLRQTLLNNGVPENILNTIDDETLRSMYAQVIQQEGIDVNNALNTVVSSNINTNITNTTNANTTANTNTINVNVLDAASLEELKNLEPSQIRELLQQFGIDKNTLDQVDDETVVSIFQEALKEQGY